MESFSTPANQVVFHAHVHLSVCWVVGLSAELDDNYKTDFQDTWMEDGSWPRINPINLLCGSG